VHSVKAAGSLTAACAQARYAADVMESAFDTLAQAPGATKEELRAGLDDLRSVPDIPGAGLGRTLHKSAAAR
jgi:hypothetical protein